MTNHHPHTPHTSATKTVIFFGVLILLAVIWITWPRPALKQLSTTNVNTANANTVLREDQFDRPAPALRLTDLDGKTIDIAATMAPAAVIIFWRTDCATCLAQLDAVSAVVNEGQGQLYAVNFGESEETVRQFVKDHPQSVRIFLDPLKTAAASYTTATLPASTFLHAGRIVGFGTGLLAADQIKQKISSVGQLE